MQHTRDRPSGNVENETVAAAQPVRDAAAHDVENHVKQEEGIHHQAIVFIGKRQAVAHLRHEDAQHRAVEIVQDRSREQNCEQHPSESQRGSATFRLVLIQSRNRARPRERRFAMNGTMFSSAHKLLQSMADNRMTNPSIVLAFKVQITSAHSTNSTNMRITTISSPRLKMIRQNGLSNLV